MHEVTLVTGAAGFIGSVVTRQLLEQGHSVVALDNFDNYYSIELKRERWERLGQLEGIHQFHGDIREQQTIRELFQRFRISRVIHLAAMAGVRSSILHPHKYFDVNLIGLLNVLECMREFGVRNLVLASTSSLYAGKSMPFKEDNDVRTPISPYAASKLGAESLAYTYHHLHGINTINLRYFTVFGPSGRPDMAPYKFTEWILNNQPIQVYGDGLQTRDFTFVEDIAAGTIAASQLDLNGWHVINLGGGERPISILEFITEIGASVGREPILEFLPPIAGDMLHTSASIERARELLNWTPKTAWIDGVHKMAEWHLRRKNRS